MKTHLILGILLVISLAVEDGRYFEYMEVRISNIKNYRLIKMILERH